MAEVQVGPPILTLNQGSTFLVTRLDGSVAPESELGLFARDTRFLSYHRITLNQKPWELVTSANLTYYGVRVVLGNPAVRTLAGSVDRHQLSMVIERALGEGVHEDLDVTNHALEPVRFFLEITVRSDFADIFDVRARRLLERGQIETRWNPDACELENSYRRPGFDRSFIYRLSSSSSQPRYANGQIVFDVDLEPGESWHACGLWVLRIDGTECEPLYDCGEAASARADNELERRQRRWRDSVTVLDCASEDVEAAYRRSVEDLGSLRLYHADVAEELWIPAAGIPWFAALFGRDSLIAAYQTMMVCPEFARGALHHLAEHQATEPDDWRDAEPGKILHELRVGELAHFKEIPHTPYYGTVDATPLFIISLHEAYRWLGEEELLRTHLDAARRAIEWIDRDGDRDGDGFLEYATRSPLGLRNQGWKDSGDAVVDADGSQVEPPIALCEVQGYAYDAKLRMAAIEERVGDPAAADRLRKEAADLFERFNEAFWMEDEGTYAFALGPDKRQVRAVASNAGHCLWSGIAPPDRAERVARRLLASDMWSGWGIRTLSSRNPAYNPLAYQRGSVWPHDNAIIATGFRRYGLTDALNRVARGILDAAACFQGFRLPELFAGFERTERGFPVQYVGANVPQAWAAGSVFMILRAMLGLEPDAAAGMLVVHPALPDWLPRIELDRLAVGNARVKLAVDRRGEECETEARVVTGALEVMIRGEAS